jgi:hypothetical protein
MNFSQLSRTLALLLILDVSTSTQVMANPPAFSHAGGNGVANNVGTTPITNVTNLGGGSGWVGGGHIGGGNAGGGGMPSFAGGGGNGGGNNGGGGGGVSSFAGSSGGGFASAGAPAWSNAGGGGAPAWSNAGGGAAVTGLGGGGYAGGGGNAGGGVSSYAGGGNSGGSVPSITGGAPTWSSAGGNGAPAWSNAGGGAGFAGAGSYGNAGGAFASGGASNVGNSPLSGNPGGVANGTNAGTTNGGNPGSLLGNVVHNVVPPSVFQDLRSNGAPPAQLVVWAFGTTSTPNDLTLDFSDTNSASATINSANTATGSATTKTSDADQLASLHNPGLLAGNFPFSTILPTDEVRSTISPPNNAVPKERAKEEYKLAMDDSVKPIAYVKPASTSLSADIIQSADARLERLAADSYQLESGNVLVCSTNSTTIKTPHATIMVKPGDVALISAQSKMTRALDLVDQHKGDVRVAAGDSTIDLYPGREVAVMAENAPEIERVVLRDQIRHRNIKLCKTDNARIVLVDEFAIPDLLKQQPLLKQLRTSNHDLHKHAHSQVMKTCAALTVLR